MKVYLELRVSPLGESLLRAGDYSQVYTVYINSIFQKSFKITPCPLVNLAAITSEPHKNF